MEENFFDLEKRNSHIQINISARNVFQIQSKIIFSLTAIHLVSQGMKSFVNDFFLLDSIAAMFYLDRELNIPSVYSAFTILCSSLIIATITHLKSRMHDPYTNYWKWLGIIFWVLSFDELVSLHEKMIDPARAFFNASGLLYFAWVIPGAIGVLILFCIFLKFLLNLPRKTRNQFLLAGFIYISGCIGCELIGGYIVDHQIGSFQYLMIMTLEETLEMFGIAIFIYGLISHISVYIKGASFEVKISGKRAKLL